MGRGVSFEAIVESTSGDRGHRSTRLGEAGLPSNLYLRSLTDAFPLLLLWSDSPEIPDAEKVDVSVYRPGRADALSPKRSACQESTLAPRPFLGGQYRKGDPVGVEHPVVPRPLGIAQRVGHRELWPRLRT